MTRLSGLWVLGALLLGGAGGMLAAGLDGPAVAAGAEVARALGGLWLNALRMTVVPLVFSLIVVGVAAAADAARAGRLAGRAVGLFVGLMFLSGLFGIGVTEFLLQVWPFDPAAAAAFVAAAGETPGEAIAAPGVADFLTGLLPTNPIAAAAEDAIVQIVLFAGALGFALTRIPEDLRAQATGLFRALAEAMIVVVRWALVVAPVGVLALSFSVGASAGAGAGVILAHYVAIVSIGIVALCVLLYALPLFGGVGLARFAAAAAPVQALAASTQSSIACLPMMVDRARGPLGLPAAAADLLLPLGVALFRVTGPCANLAVAWIVAHLSGVEPTVLQIAAAALLAPAMSAGAVGLPGQVSFFTSIAPLCLALGAPVPLLGVFIAVEVAPDIFRTIGNVTGHLGAAAALGGRERAAP